MTKGEGYICKLTNRAADFKNSCPSFSIDKEEKDKTIKEYINKIEESLKNQTKWTKKKFNYDPILQYLVDSTTNKPLDKHILEKEKIIFEHRKRKLSFLIPSLIIIAALLKGLYDGQFHDLPKVSLIFLGLMALGAFYLIYLFILKPEIFRISKLGIIVGKKDFIPWNRIDYIHYRTVQGQNITKYYLVLDMHWGFGEEKPIEITYADMDQEEIRVMVYSYMKTFKSN